MKRCSTSTTRPALCLLAEARKATRGALVFPGRRAGASCWVELGVATD